MFTPEYLKSLRASEDEKAIKDVKQQIRQLNARGDTSGRVYLEGNINFDKIKTLFESWGFKLGAPSSDDGNPIANLSYWCSWDFEDS